MDLKAAKEIAQITCSLNANFRTLTKITSTDYTEEVKKYSLVGVGVSLNRERNVTNMNIVIPGLINGDTVVYWHQASNPDYWDVNIQI